MFCDRVPLEVASLSLGLTTLTHASCSRLQDFKIPVVRAVGIYAFL